MNENSKGSVLLLVDDDKLLVELYSMKFTREGYKVQACLSAKDALTALRNGFVPDLILFDIQIPEQDGFSFLKTLLAEHLAPNSRLIALTNETADSARTTAEQLGASGYIVKATMTPAEVVGATEQVMAARTKA